MRTSGIVLGKFMPLHLGHCHLIEFARSYVDDLTVLVDVLQGEAISRELRRYWVAETFPGVTVKLIPTENPQSPDEHPDFWSIWRESILSVLPAAPTFVFASEEYGEPLATVLGATFIPVDIGRKAVPTSGTAARGDLFAAWEMLPPVVRAHYVKRVVVVGPESTGKSTLARNLAEHFKTVSVPEYARELIEQRQEPPRLEDMPTILRGQLAAEDSLARMANRVMFCDTDPILSTVWSEVLFGMVSPQLREIARTRQYAHYLLTSPDVPWISDSVRYLPGGGKAFFNRTRELLEAYGRPYTVIQGSWKARMQSAVSAVEAACFGRGADVAA